MKKRTFISIGLHAGKQVVDLQIPNQVTSARLTELLKEALPLLGIDLPKHFTLEVLNKPIRLEEQTVLACYPLGDGDQLGIKEVSISKEEKHR